jgi:DNA processing protein
MRSTDSTVVTPADVLGTLNDVELKYAPRELHLAGDRSLLWLGARVSLIGSRKASSEGLRRTRVLASSLVEHGMIVVSGLAADPPTVTTV